MNKSQSIISRIFKKDFSFKTIICYKNPNECTSFNIERVNPDHVGIIWGKRKKTSRGNNVIKIGKVYFSSVVLSYGLMVAGYMDAFTSYAYGVLLNIGVVSLLVGCAVGTVVYLPLFITRRNVCQVNGGLS